MRTAGPKGSSDLGFQGPGPGTDRLGADMLNEPRTAKAKAPGTGVNGPRSGCRRSVERNRELGRQGSLCARYLIA